MKHRVCFFLLVIFLIPVCNSQSKIKNAEESLEKTEKTKRSSFSSNNNDNDDSEGDFLTEIIGGLFLKLFTYTAYGIAFESPFEIEHRGSTAILNKHPYKNTNTGNYSYNWNENSEIFTTYINSRFIFETNNVYGNHLNVDMRFLKRLGLEIDYLQLWEETANSGNYTLAIYTAIAKYQRVRTERFNGWWGLGAAYINGNVNKLGFTYGLGAEWFFVKPFSLEANFNQTLINNNSINKFNTLLNYHKKQYKFIGGYEHLKIGDVGFSNLTIGIGVSL